MKHKLGLIGFSYLSGLICAAFFRSWAVTAIICAALTLIMIAAAVHRKKAAVVALASALAASVVCGIYTLTVYEPLISKDGETAELSGTISEIRRYSGDRASYTVNTEIDGISTAITMFAPDYYCDIGDTIEFSGKLSVLRNNADFSEESYYRSKGIFLKVNSPSDIKITHTDFSLKAVIFGFSDYIGSKISQTLTGDEGDLIKAMFLGDKSDLSYELSENIKRSGISHFTAVSGLHLTVIAHIIMLMLSLTPIKRHRYLRYGILIVLILMFAVFFRLSVSVIRAGIMLIIYYGAEPFMRKGSTINSMGFAILVITLFNPYACLDAGLLLSLAGAFGIGVIAPIFTNRFRKNRAYEIKSALTGTFCATAATFPLSCIFFGGFSVIGIVTNLVIYPLFFPLLICMILFTVCGGQTSLFLLPAGLCTKAMAALIKLLGSFKYAYINIRYEIMIPICIISAMFVCFIYCVFRSKRETLISAILSVCVLSGAYAAIKLSDKNSAALLLYSDGSDACIIIESGDETAVCASGDSTEITECIKGYIKDSYIDKINVISLIRSNHNNLAAFEALPCDRLIISEEYGMEKYNGNSLSLVCGDGCSAVTIGDVCITVSSSGKAKDSSINILYGYKKALPDLEGITFYASSRADTGGNDCKNIYFEPSDYLITDYGFLEKINLFN